MKSKWSIFPKNSQKGSAIPLIFLIIVLGAGAYYYFGKNSVSLDIGSWFKNSANSELSDSSGVNDINDDPENPNKQTKSNLPQSKYTSKSGLWTISYPITWRVDSAVGEMATFSNYGESQNQSQKPIISVIVTLSDPSIDFGNQINKELKDLDNDPIHTYTKEPLTVVGGKGSRVIYYDKSGQTKITKVLYIFPLNVANKKSYLIANVELFDSAKSTYKPGLTVADTMTLNLTKAASALQNR